MSGHALKFIKVGGREDKHGGECSCGKWMTDHWYTRSGVKTAHSRHVREEEMRAALEGPAS